MQQHHQHVLIQIRIHIHCVCFLPPSENGISITHSLNGKKGNKIIVTISISLLEGLERTIS